MEKLPKKLGECIDLAYQRRADRLLFQKRMEEQLEEFKKAEAEINKHIIDSFTKAEINGAKGSICSAGLVPFTKATVKDWGELFPWIAKHKAWDLLYRRVSDKAFVERLEAKQVIPGVERFDGVKLSLTKIGEKKPLGE